MSHGAASMGEGPRVLVPDWYAPRLGPPCASVEQALADRFGPRVLGVAERFGPLRGILVFLAAARADRVALPKNAPGTRTFMALEATRGRRDRAILVAFLVRTPPRARWRRLVYRAWFYLVERAAPTP